MQVKIIKPLFPNSICEGGIIWAHTCVDLPLAPFPGLHLEFEDLGLNDAVTRVGVSEGQVCAFIGKERYFGTTDDTVLNWRNLGWQAAVSK